MKRNTSTRYLPPSSYAGIVQAARDHHERRLAELKLAAKLIHAIEPDLAELGRRGVHYSVQNHSMRREDCRSDRTIGRAVYALTIDTGIFSESGDRLIRGFIELGYEVERVQLDKYFPQAVLRKPRTHVRVMVHGTADYVNGLKSVEAA